jgi:hypothetical protein
MSPILLSLTSIPRRFETTLPEVVRSLRRQSVDSPVLVNIPTSYRKWGPATVPAWLDGMNEVHVHRPSMDYGPATKLLGALEYARERPEIEYIVTCDDDMVPRSSRHIEHLITCARLLPGCAVTIKGIELLHPPYRARNGLDYRSRNRPVHAPAGYNCVVYPARKLLETATPFTLRNTLADGVFHDDDAYFGLVLSVLNIPLIAVPGQKTRSVGDDGGSGVAEAAGRDRRDNEMDIFSTAVRDGHLSVPPRRYNMSWRQRFGTWRSHVVCRGSS